jgi:integrase
MDWTVFLAEFEADWKLLGRSKATLGEYLRLLRDLRAHSSTEPCLASVKAWLATSRSKDHARYRGRAVRAFGKWAEANDVQGWSWWRQVPLANVAPTPQDTVTAAQVEELLRRLTEPRDRLIVELLWSTGLRVSELSRLRWDDVNLDDGYVVVRQSKTGKPRLAPLSARACRMIRRTPRCVDSLLAMSTQAIQRRLNRIGAPTAHAFRRGWAVQALRQGVSQTSVQAAAGWSSGAMVNRYVSQRSSSLAMEEFLTSRTSQR